MRAPGEDSWRMPLVAARLQHQAHRKGQELHCTGKQTTDHPRSERRIKFRASKKRTLWRTLFEISNDYNGRSLEAEKSARNADAVGCYGHRIQPAQHLFCDPTPTLQIRTKPETSARCFYFRGDTPTNAESRTANKTRVYTQCNTAGNLNESTNQPWN